MYISTYAQVKDLLITPHGAFRKGRKNEEVHETCLVHIDDQFSLINSHDSDLNTCIGVYRCIATLLRYSFSLKPNIFYLSARGLAVPRSGSEWDIVYLAIGFQRVRFSTLQKYFSCIGWINKHRFVLRLLKNHQSYLKTTASFCIIKEQHNLSSNKY